VNDAKAVRERGESLGISFDAVNSNTFQDQAGQAQSYRYGSLSHTSAAVRDQAVKHNIECIALGKALGSKALTVWVGDGTNFPGQQALADSLDRYLESAKASMPPSPEGWRMFIEHKLYEPAFYSHRGLRLGHELPRHQGNWVPRRTAWSTWVTTRPA